MYNQQLDTGSLKKRIPSSPKALRRKIVAQRVLKIFLPADEKRQALQILETEKKLLYWQEELSETHFIASILTEAEDSEPIMDLFERNYSATKGFKLIVFPVEASIPHREKTEDDKTEKESNTRKKTRISREELYADLVDSASLTSTFLLMTVLSTLVVAVGLQQNSVAIIIGAMVIAPFLGPNVAIALATCLSDKTLGINSLKTLAAGICIAVLLSTLFGYFFGPNPDLSEIATRTRVHLLDIVLALASGCAGVLAFTTGASSAVIGVMVAVALLPPLTVGGLMLGSGNFHAAGGAFLLFAANIICINFSGVFTFLCQGITPRIWWQANKAKRNSKTALLFWSLPLCLLFFIVIFFNFR